MVQESSHVFVTRFGQYVPCNRPTYRKLKRIRHLAAFAEAMARRWTRAQRRLPKNRVFRRGRARRVVSDAMLFIPFWQPRAGSVEGSPLHAGVTPLLEMFMQDYRSARNPVLTEAAVVPLKLAGEEIDALLAALERWHEEVFLPW